ncbi:MAG: hypothetical protein RLZZ267_311 [Bacillota bacterium]|jgi:hypothetical protein
MFLLIALFGLWLMLFLVNVLVTRLWVKPYITNRLVISRLKLVWKHNRQHQAFKRVSDIGIAYALKLFEKRRQARQVNELIIMIRQLLYFRDIPINLHAKLRKCVPVVRVIRSDLMKLCTEWYEDPEKAIQLFRYRVNNQHAEGVCDTLISIFQYEHEDYYTHLESRMNQLKQVQKQNKETRKESRSYVLFILSGLPLIHSFQIFIYPWLIEGNQLFDQLN